MVIEKKKEVNEQLNQSQEESFQRPSSDNDRKHNKERLKRSLDAAAAKMPPKDDAQDRLVDDKKFDAQQNGEAHPLRIKSGQSANQGNNQVSSNRESRSFRDKEKRISSDIQRNKSGFQEQADQKSVGCCTDGSSVCSLF